MGLSIEFVPGMRTMLRTGVAVSGMAAALITSSSAIAQQATVADDENKADIVVTGTLVRGVAPAGTNVVSVDKQAVESSGATTVTELLTDVPQFGAFNDLQTLSGGNNF